MARPKNLANMTPEELKAAATKDAQVAELRATITSGETQLEAARAEAGAVALGLSSSRSAETLLLAT